MKRILCIALILMLAGGSCLAVGRSVLDTGAVGDGQTDNTAAFQKALDEAGNAGGGIVNVPTGQFRINGNLVIPASVTLQGTYRCPPTARAYDFSEIGGSVLMAYAGRGSTTGEPFIKIGGTCATVAGLIITYPEWKRTDVPPIPYPPCIASTWIDNPSIIDCNIETPMTG
jgi:hypothetical protein